MSESHPINIMIHDLNPWGGQDRSMLEIAWQLNKKFPLHIHSYGVEGYQDWPNMKHTKYHSRIKRPIIFKYLSYHFQTWNRLKNSKGWIQSTGTASLVCDTVQVQFIHHSWLKIAPTLPMDKSAQPFFLKSLYHQFLNRYKKSTERKVYTPEKKYVAISHSIKKELMDHFAIPPEQIKIIHHGVDAEHFHPWQEGHPSGQKREEIRKTLGFRPTDQVLLHVGALNARKGIFQTFKVLSYLKKHGFNNIKFLAVGGGDQTIIRELIEKYDLRNEVVLAPHSKDIREYYWAADVFFFPSFYEPFGLVILEALACGLPVVTSSLAGGAELIDHDVNGVLFDPNLSIPKIADRLLPVLKDKGHRDSLIEQGLVTARRRSWQSVGVEYQDFYERLGAKD